MQNASVSGLKASLNRTPELVQLEKAGLVKIGRGGLPEGFWSMVRPTDSSGEALRVLLEEREGGR
jgi:hypothetical protein